MRAATRFPTIRRLILADFRSYAALDIRVTGQMVLLTGDNGAGKTNLLEALSMLTPGRGLRRADAADLARAGGSGNWAVSIELDDSDHHGASVRQIGTGIETSEGSTARRCRIDRAVVPSAKSFADHLRVVWLTPAMDGLFAGPATERRRFLDRIVLTVDTDHATRVNALDRALRNRNRILEDGRAGSLNRAWAEAAEHEVAGLGVAVAAARAETVARLAALIAETRDDASPFPWADVMLRGDVETLLERHPAVEVEDLYRDMLRSSRPRDMAAGRTSIGPHVSDLLVRHGPKAVEAARASTGEQKALVVGLVLAQARLVASLSGIAPMILLDEIAAHFDPSRRRALFAALRSLGGQVFMTGADPVAFGDAGAITRLTVEAGSIRATPDDAPM
ncbi:DNA replication/repair protein RecF [Lichenihabitans psoromatis]|uniref:DNA replication/repair protein RecF n=1 Tax=Lichenihabitans psoromatis TaxID=2528642 RepID=UPI001038515F|nr:DNA replication/repair protein RecF [Lichenihabitans psoromatis]